MHPSNILFFDVETNAPKSFSTLDGLETVHCLCIFDPVGLKSYSFRKNFQEDNIEEGLELLRKANAICGHNVIGFDVPALFKLYNFKHSYVIDTLTMSRCIFPDIKASDFSRMDFPKKLIGSHSLESWGYRIGVKKDCEAVQSEDWSAWSQEMEDYCVQDVTVTYNLYKYLMKKSPDERMLELEHDFATHIRQQEFNGFPFDKEAALQLCSTLSVRRVELEEELQLAFPPRVETMKTHVWVTPNGQEFDFKTEALKAGFKQADIQKGRLKTREVPFNPLSRDQIAERLMEAGWKPNAYEGKRPTIDEAVLKRIDTPEAELLLEYLLIMKRLGQVAEGRNAWLKMIQGDRIHGSVNTNGAVSGRCTHRSPNVAQTPSSRSPYGKECRSCFTAPKGKVLVGADASGLELRALAGYLYFYDKGEYVKIVTTGDVHTANQEAAGLATRDQAKTYIYALCYGAGDAKIGEIVRGTSADGRRLKESFKNKFPAYGRLMADIGKTVDAKGFLTGLDGRKLPCRSKHSALNVLLQSAGAVIMKKALVLFVKKARHPFEMHGNIHDEVQFSCEPQHADSLGQCFVDALEAAGKELNFNCPLTGEYSVGDNWSETH